MSTQNDKSEYIFKVIILGDGAVGKTSMVLQFTEHKFNENYIMSLGANFAIKMIDYPEYLVRLQLWDLAGQKHFHFVRPGFYRGAFAVIYVFDLTRRKTFKNVDAWTKEARQYLDPKTPEWIVGNKVDLVDERVVSKSQGREKAQDMGAINYYETSAKTAENLDTMFAEVIKTIIKQNNIKIGEF